MKSPTQARPLFADNEPTPRGAWPANAAGAWSPLHESMKSHDTVKAVPTAEAEAAAQSRERAYEEGLHKAKTAMDSLIASYQEGILALAAQRQEIELNAQREVVRLAVYIAEQAIAGDIRGRHHFVERMTQQALAAMRDADKVTLRLASPDLKALLKKHPELVHDTRHFEVVEDASMPLGGVTARCSFGRFDADLRTRLDAIAKQLDAAFAENADV